VRDDGRLNLSLNVPRILREEGKKAMRCGCGNNVEKAFFFEGLIAPENIFAVGIGKVLQILDIEIPVHQSEGSEIQIILRPYHFLLSELDEPLQMEDVTRLEKFIREHAGKGRGKGYRDSERHGVVSETLEYPQQGEIGLGNGLEQPALLQKSLVLRMPHKGEMGMKHETEKTFRHSFYDPLYLCTSNTRMRILAIHEGNDLFRTQRRI
jgi:hypothetical protein